MLLKKRYKLNHHKIRDKYLLDFSISFLEAHSQRKSKAINKRIIMYQLRKGWITSEDYIFGAHLAVGKLTYLRCFLIIFK